MSYERMNLKDGQRWRAEHVQHLEDGIVQNESDISTNAFNLIKEAENRAAADASIKADITKEIDDRTSAVATVDTKLDTEIYDRRTADNKIEETLTTRIADVEMNINSEISNREAAVTELTNRIDTTDENVTEVKKSIETVGTNLTEEITNRTDADKTLTDSIDAVEVSLTTEVTERKADTEVLNNRISQEVKDRENSDDKFTDKFTTLEGKVDSNTEFITDVDSKLRSDIPDIIKTTLESGYINFECRFTSTLQEGESIVLNSFTPSEVSNSDYYTVQCDTELNTSEDAYIITCNI